MTGSAGTDHLRLKFSGRFWVSTRGLQSSYLPKGRTRRFNALQRSIPDVSKKTLTQTLRKLEQRGLVHRLVHPVVPPHVDYSLTPVGAKFAEAVALLCNWAEKNKAILKQVDRTLNGVD